MVELTTNNRRLAGANQRIADQCERLGTSGYCSVGITHPNFAKSETANEFLFWFPQGIPDGLSVSVASSRMSQKLDEHREWFDAIRTLAVHVSNSSKFLMTARGTTTDAFVCRLADLFGIALVEFERFPKRPSKKWFNDQTIVRENFNGNVEPRFKAWFKPLEDSDLQSNVDELLIGLADSTFLLAVKKNGNIHQSALRRLKRPTQPATRLLINRKLTPKPVESDLLERGATAWWLYDQGCSRPKSSSQGESSSHETRTPNAIILTLDEIRTEDYVSHWTRRRVGPWPDQTTPEYLDELIFFASGSKHNEVSALCRMLALGRILGSNGLTRDPRDVVCFSDLPLNEILNRRVFRPHLSRWDFEPFGIAIDRDLVWQFGARPVVYGDESDWERLGESEKAFFQLKISKSEEIDWTEEREWRLVGDLKLDQIPMDKAVVFVKSESDAVIVAELSRWPVVVLEERH